MSQSPLNNGASPVHPFTWAVDYVQERSSAIAELVKSHGSPLYVFDKSALRAVALEYKEAFSERLGRHRAFFAIKSNPSVKVLAFLTELGFGMDVSSPEEFDLAKTANNKSIVFSGPAKKSEDLRYVLQHDPGTVVHVDSWGELERLAGVARELGIVVSCGVRVYHEEVMAWSKFGIPLGDLRLFYDKASGYRSIRLDGIQMHRSGHSDFAPYCQAISALGVVLRKDFSQVERERFKFVDIGGGFMSNLCEADYEEYETPRVGGVPVLSRNSAKSYQIAPYPEIQDYALNIGKALQDNFQDLHDCEFWTEPGRAIAARALHLVLSVVDIKGDLAITDGGENMIGWDKYLQRYCPVVNITRPAKEELPVVIAGSLCDPDDLWGFSCFAAELKAGDVLVLPFQGAYTFAHAKRFIRAIPQIVELPS